MFTEIAISAVVPLLAGGATHGLCFGVCIAIAAIGILGVRRAIGIGAGGTLNTLTIFLSNHALGASITQHPRVAPPKLTAREAVVASRALGAYSVKPNLLEVVSSITFVTIGTIRSTNQATILVFNTGWYQAYSRSILADRRSCIDA